MRSTRRTSAVTATVIALTLAMAGPAAAATPDNDDIGDAATITALPFTDTVDTTDATEATDDPDCFGAGPTVWYALTLPEGTFVELNTFGSDYDTTLSAYTGEPGNLQQIACNDDAGFGVQSRIRFDAAAGQTYYVMAGAFASGPGGDLVLNASETQPSEPAHVDVTLDPIGSVQPRTGTAWLSGTVTCTGAEFVELFGELRQRAGRAIITGWGFDFLPCETDTPFMLEIQGQNGLFAGGRADALVEAFACNEDECGFDVAEQEVRLRGGGPR